MKVIYHGDALAIPEIGGPDGATSARIEVAGVDITRAVLTDVGTFARCKNTASVRKMGQDLHDAGGLRLMQGVFYALIRDKAVTREQRAWLEHAWDGVGEWAA